MKTKGKTKIERRLIILKDALKQLKLKKLIANTGDVLDLNYTGSCSLSPTNNTGEEQVQSILKKLLKDKSFTCKVCARGALLISTIHKENSFTKEQLNNVSGGTFSPGSEEDKRLLNLFSEQQLILMENAFEGGINDGLLDIDLARKSVTFGSKYKNDTDRLIAILQNAIKNNGRFRP